MSRQNCGLRPSNLRLTCHLGICIPSGCKTLGIEIELQRSSSASSVLETNDASTLSVFALGFICSRFFQAGRQVAWVATYAHSTIYKSCNGDMQRFDLRPGSCVVVSRVNSSMSSTTKSTHRIRCQTHWADMSRHSHHVLCACCMYMLL